MTIKYVLYFMYSCMVPCKTCPFKRKSNHALLVESVRLFSKAFFSLSPKSIVFIARR